MIFQRITTFIPMKIAVQLEHETMNRWNQSIEIFEHEYSQLIFI